MKNFMKNNLPLVRRKFGGLSGRSSFQSNNLRFSSIIPTVSTSSASISNRQFQLQKTQQQQQYRFFGSSKKKADAEKEEGLSSEIEGSSGAFF